MVFFYQNKQKEFIRALPTTIYQAGFSEIMEKPGVDCTALIVSKVACILECFEEQIVGI